MTEIMSKTSVFTLCNHPNDSKRNYVNPKNYNTLSFSSLILKVESLRASTDNLDNIMSFQGFEEIPRKLNSPSLMSNAQMNLRIGKVEKWWEKGLQPNMKEVTSAQDLVDSLLSVGDKLVAVDFYSPGCGGCKALHPKICQFAEMNPNVQFLQVNYEEHKSMCYSLGVHVLPFFRFYRGAEGRLCSFSCTNATVSIWPLYKFKIYCDCDTITHFRVTGKDLTLYVVMYKVLGNQNLHIKIKKFKDALAKHGGDRCNIGPTKGLEEELLALAANNDLSFNYVPKPMETAIIETASPNSDNNKRSDPLSSTILKPGEDSEENLVTTER